MRSVGATVLSTTFAVLGLWSLAILNSCASSQRTPASEPVVAMTVEERKADPLYQKAKQFDEFLADDLSKKEMKAVTLECKKTPEQNPFCYSYAHSEELDEKLKRKDKRIRPRRARQPRVRPKIAQKTVKNWLVMRFSSVNSILKGLSNLSPSEFSVLKKTALNEEKCPNNVAIAVAATLEDDLPDIADPEEIARLYEIGGDCITKNPSDRESILTRAGLFYFLKRNYKKAVAVLTKSANTPDAFVGRALYWTYRAHQELKDTDAADEALDNLATKYPFAFHTLVANMTLDRDPGRILVHQRATSKKTSQVPAVNQLIEQAEILRRFEFRRSASHVLDWAVVESSESEPEFRVYLAELKSDEQDSYSRISILSDVLYKNPTLISKETMELYFPRVFFPIFEKKSSGLDPYLLLAIARQESAFNPRAVSSANAQGLLQVHPATGRQVMKGKRPNLMDPELNVEIASRHLQDLLQKLNGQIHLVLAAYNAGGNRVSLWLNRYPTIEPVLFIDILPYRETRDYVATILRNYYWYRRIHEGSGDVPSKLFRVELSQKPSP